MIDNNRIFHIEDLEDERVSLYTTYNEPQLLHYNEPDSGIFIAETPKVIDRAIAYGAKPLSFFAETGALQNGTVQAVIEKTDKSVPVLEAELSIINKITGFNLTRGLLAIFERPALPDANSILEDCSKIVVLEDIVNPTNVGAIFRSAAALGMEAVFLTSGCSDPFYRRAARVSMGTVFMVPWTYLPKESCTVDILHENGFTVISMETGEDSVPLKDPVLRTYDKTAVIFGAEGAGISKETLKKSDMIVNIPMQNGVDSLNVAAASAVTFWELCR
ncbi:MAG: RNA methyltransferase [Lachnospiraceae bacterium]|nr:RNA methyltransferase [Lachnospiraceae bacterium]